MKLSGQICISTCFADSLTPEQLFYDLKHPTMSKNIFSLLSSWIIQNRNGPFSTFSFSHSWKLKKWDWSEENERERERVCVCVCVCVCTRKWVYVCVYICVCDVCLLWHHGKTKCKNIPKEIKHSIFSRSMFLMLQLNSCFLSLSLKDVHSLAWRWGVSNYRFSSGVLTYGAFEWIFF